MKLSILAENSADTLAKACGLSIVSKARSSTARQTAGGTLDGFKGVGGRQYGSTGTPTKSRHRKFLGCGQRPGAITPPGI